MPRFFMQSDILKNAEFKMQNYIIYAICLFNAAVFVLYGIDKLKAVRGKHRISEKVLLTLPFFMASLGAMLGMIVFNHKTSKTKFRIIIPLSFIINILIFILFTNLQIGDKIYFIHQKNFTFCKTEGWYYGDY